jgi:hypothetical protein
MFSHLAGFCAKTPVINVSDWMGLGTPARGKPLHG